MSTLQTPMPGLPTHFEEVYHEQGSDLNVLTAGLQFEEIEFQAGAPKVDITLEPKDGDYLMYHLTPGFTFFETQKAQLSVLALMQNKETANVDLDKVVFQYQQGNQTITKTITLPSDQKVIGPGSIGGWQNNREYHETGDVIYLESPFPAQITVKFYFKNYTIPLSITKKLKPFNVGFTLPFKTNDLRTDEYWSGYSMHGGGEQVFAYDLGVEAYASNSWSGVLPGKNGTENNHYRVWGKPVYAMADGVVIHSLNVCPNNPKPIIASTKEEADKIAKEQQDLYWGAHPYGGAGNHFYIRHGNLVALYAHMQKGSLTSGLLPKGSVVKKGDFLGYAGNAGSSSGPHLHIHVKTYKNDSEPEGGLFRPLLFNNGYVIGKEHYTKPFSNVNWTKMDNEGIPGLKGKACYIWPSDTHLYCDYPTNWGEVSKHALLANNFQSTFDHIWTCGYYPVMVNGYDVNGNTYFNLIFRPSKGVQWVARHNMDGNKYQEEFNTWDKEGYNLLNVDSYLQNGQVRYAAVWVKDNRTIMAYHGQTLDWHESKFKGFMDAGWVPVNVSCLVVGGQTYVTALWEKKNTGGFYLRPAMTLEEYKNYFNDYSKEKGFKLVYLNAYVKHGKPMLSGIWYKNAPGYDSWWAKHHLSTAEYQNEYTSQLGNGYTTRCVTGYEDGDTARFEGIWAK